MPEERETVELRMVEWLRFLLHIWEVPGSNFRPDAGYPDSGFHGFPQSVQANDE
jgi:hypothetical protein